MKKRIFAIVMVMALGLSACRNQSEVPATTQQDISSPPSESAVIIDESRVVENYPADKAFAGGEGTEASPFEIATAGQLALLAKYVNENVEMEDGKKYRQAWYILTEDIEINDTSHFSEWEHTPPEFSWSAIGDYRDYARFQGHFDGNGHTVSGLYYYGVYNGEGSPEPDHSVGLFGSIDDAVVENVTLEKSYICRLGGMGAGGLMYKCEYSTIKNCRSSATVCCDRGNTAGIAAYATDSQIINCINTGTVSVEDSVSDCGGIIGLGCGISVDGCQNIGRVSAGGGGAAGGIIGSVIASAGDELNMQITNCINQGEVDGSKSNGGAGGIGGDFDCGKGYLTVSNCQNTGTVTSSGSSGGLFGQVCGRVSGISNPEQIPGIVLVENCENSGTVFAKKFDTSDRPCIGGLIGSISTSDSGEVTISKCVNHADLNADTEKEMNVAGIVAGCTINRGGTLRLNECTNRGTLKGSDLQTAGILGTITQNSSETVPGVIEITACENAGDITGNGLTVGGILGWTLLFSGEKDVLTIRDCRNVGALTGYSTMQIGGIGGIAGYLSGEEGKISIIGCSNSAPITLDMGQVDLERFNMPNVSGTVGLIESSVATVDGCSNNGRISVMANGKEVPEYSSAD